MNRNARERASMAPYSLFSLSLFFAPFKSILTIENDPFKHNIAWRSAFFVSIFTRITRKVTQKLMNYYWRKKKQIKNLHHDSMLDFKYSCLCMFSLKCRSKWTLFKRSVRIKMDSMEREIEMISKRKICSNKRPYQDCLRSVCQTLPSEWIVVVSLSLYSNSALNFPLSLGLMRGVALFFVALSGVAFVDQKWSYGFRNGVFT